MLLNRREAVKIREIIISGADYFLDTVIGYEGEHNITNLNIKLPTELISDDIDYYTVDFQTSAGNVVSSAHLQQNGGYIIVPLWQQTTINGELKFQVKAWALTGDIVDKIAMTPLITRIIGESVDGNAVLLNEEVGGLMAELQSLIANYPEKIVVERVEDLPENPEDGIDALVTGALPTGGAVKNDPFMQYFSIGGNWYKIGSEAIEYADLYAPYAGYPFRVVQDAFYEFGQYDTPENISLKKGDCPLPSSVFPEGVHRSEAVFYNRETKKSISIGVYDGTEADTLFELDAPYVLLRFFDIVQATIYLNLFEQTEVDGVVFEPGCYLVADDFSPTAIDKSTIPEFKNYRLVHDSWFVVGGAPPPNPLNPQFLGYYFNNAVPNVYYWNGAEYVGVSGADLYAITVNEVAPINGNITLDTSNIEPTNDRQYLTNIDNYLLYALRGENEGAEFPYSSFILSGSFNEITGDNSVIVAGAFNSVSGYCSAIVGGAGNLVSASYSETIGGEGLIASADYSAIVGKYGETPAGSLFVVANGEYGAPNIAFYVGSDGVSHFDEMPVVPADRVINADNQLVDKKYVDENSGSVPIVAYTNALYIGKSHTLTTGDNTTFTLPTVSNPAVLNQFRIEIKATSAISVTWTGGNLRAGGVAYVYGVGAHVVIGTWSTIQEKWLLDAQIYGGV